MKNELYKEYHICECGIRYTNYINGKCAACRKPDRDLMAKKLEPLREKELEYNLKFSKAYGKDKIKTPLPTKKGAERKGMSRSS